MASQHRLAADMSDQVEVITAPMFITVPKSHFTVAEGRNAHFEAKVEPITDPNLQIEWLRNGSPITVGHRFRPIHDFGYVALDVIGTIEEDSGLYTCRAINAAGQAEFNLQLECRSKIHCGTHERAHAEHEYNAQ